MNTERPAHDAVTRAAFEELMKTSEEINKREREEENARLPKLHPLERQRILNERMIKDFIFGK